MNPEITGIILAGGKSQRMGRNKAFIRVNGKSIIERTVNILKTIFTNIIIVTNSPEEYQGFDAIITTDIIPGKGSLGGLYTGLKISPSLYSFVVACDMPFLNKEVIEYLISQKGDFEVIVPEINSEFQPLHAIYSKECIKYIEELVQKNDLKIINFYPKIRVKKILKKELLKYDPELRSFYNVNYPEDLITVCDSDSRP